MPERNDAGLSWVDSTREFMPICLSYMSIWLSQGIGCRSRGSEQFNDRNQTGELLSSTMFLTLIFSGGLPKLVRDLADSEVAACMSYNIVSPGKRAASLFDQWQGK